MEESRHGLGEAALNLDLTAPMRSRISDSLVPPPALEKESVEKKYDPKAISERIWIALMSNSLHPSGKGGVEFEAHFHLRGGKGFILRGDKEGFGSIQPMEPFMEVHEKLLETYHKDVVKVDIFTEDKAVTFSSYDDLLEWLEI